MDKAATEGWIEGDAHYFPVRIYYQDTDVSGIVYHANYLNFFERGRTEYLRILGVYRTNLDRSDPDGYTAFAIRDLAVDYKRPAHLDDLLVVKTTCQEVKGASCTLRQEVYRDETLLVSAILRVVFLNVDLKPKRVPDELRRHFGATIQSQRGAESSTS